jgi:hypothetical protein
MANTSIVDLRHYLTSAGTPARILAEHWTENDRADAGVTVEGHPVGLGTNLSRWPLDPVFEALRRNWEDNCRSAARGDPRIAGRIGKSSHDVPRIHVHHNDSLASGNVVVSSQQFPDYLQRKVDRTLRGIEMEAGGLFEALDTADWRGRVLVLRDISDYSNKQKWKLEKRFGTAWRQYAMQNAVRLAAMLLQQRPKWERERMSVSPSYDLSLTPHSESHRHCADVQVNSTGVGAQNLVFLPLLTRHGGTPRLWVTVQNKADTLPNMLLRERADPYVETRYYMRPNGTLEVSKEGTDRPFTFDLFVSSANGPIAFKVTIRDEFGRTEELRFPQ